MLSQILPTLLPLLHGVQIGVAFFADEYDYLIDVSKFATDILHRAKLIPPQLVVAFIQMIKNYHV